MLATASTTPVDPLLASVAPGRAGVHILDGLIPVSTPISLQRDEELLAQGDHARFCWLVVTGCVRAVTLLQDGRRQISAFMLPGDVFGWEAAGTHACAAEAVTASTLRRFRLSVIEQHADTNPVFGRRLRDYGAAQLRAAQSHMVLLGRRTAAERIACFLLEMQRRLPMAGTDARVIELPMGRADMADYLGLTIETVCRGLTELRRSGAIGVTRTRIAIHDHQALDGAGSGAMH